MVRPQRRGELLCIDGAEQLTRAVPVAGGGVAVAIEVEQRLIGRQLAALKRLPGGGLAHFMNTLVGLLALALGKLAAQLFETRGARPAVSGAVQIHQVERPTE